MAMRVSNSRTLSSALRSSRVAFTRRNEPIVRTFTATHQPQIVVSSDQPNMRHAQRSPDAPEGLRAPPINPADKYAAKADDLHKYGAWLMGCLPKYVQQFSVWKDELVIYISPAGVIPVFTFLKCDSPTKGSEIIVASANFSQITHLQSIHKSLTSPLSISQLEISGSRLYTIY